MANARSLRSWDAMWEKLQRFLGFSGVESPFGRDTNPVIDEPTTLYVETTGNDSNPGTKLKPFLTIQAALDSLKGRDIAAAVTIQIGVGTFSGFQWPKLQISRFATVTVQGTMVAATPLTGTASGTATSGSSATVNDTGQSWTAHDLKGKWVALSTAPTSYWQIVSNTPTSFIFISSVTPAAGNTYTISQSGTIVKSDAVYGTASLRAGCVLMETTSDYTATCSVRCIKFTTEFGGNYCVAQTPRASMAFSTCEFYVSSLGTSSAAIAGLWLGGSSAYTTLSRSFFNLEKAGATGYAGIGHVSPQVCYFKGGNKTQTGIHASDTSKVSTPSANVFENLKYAYGSSLSYVAGSGFLISSLMGTFIDCDTVCYLQGQVGITDSKSNYPSFPLSSSGNTTFILIDCLAQIQVHSNVPSGLAVTDISVNGVTSTLAAMRALTPKVFPGTPNAYGSYVYE